MNEKTHPGFYNYSIAFACRLPYLLKRKGQINRLIDVYVKGRTCLYRYIIKILIYILQKKYIFSRWTTFSIKINFYISGWEDIFRCLDDWTLEKNPYVYPVIFFTEGRKHHEIFLWKMSRTKEFFQMMIEWMLLCSLKGFLPLPIMTIIKVATKQSVIKERRFERFRSSFPTFSPTDMNWI